MKNLINPFFTKEGDGNDVLFLHGWGCDGSIFKSSCKLLDGFRLTFVDLWGFGNTPMPDEFKSGGMSVEDYADGVAGFICRNDFKNLTVVGHSFGGRIAVTLAAKYPLLLKKLVLVDAAGLRKKSLKRWLKVRRYKFLKRKAKRNEKAKEKLALYGSSDFKTLKDELRPTFFKAINQSLDGFARRVSVPTLLVYGEKDSDTPLWIAKRYRRLIKGSGLVVIDGCGHFCFLEKSKFFAAVLKSFLES